MGIRRDLLLVPDTEISLLCPEERGYLVIPDHSVYSQRGDK